MRRTAILFSLILFIHPIDAVQKHSKGSYLNNNLPIELNNSNGIIIKSENVFNTNTNKLYDSNNVDDPWNEAITSHSDSNSVSYLNFGPEEDIIKVVSRYTFNKNDYSNTTELNYSYLKSLRFFIEDKIEYSIYGEGTLHIGICDTWDTEQIGMS